VIDRKLLAEFRKNAQAVIRCADRGLKASARFVQEHPEEDPPNQVSEEMRAMRAAGAKQLAVVDRILASGQWELLPELPSF
jgi:hypothetical protein